MNVRKHAKVIDLAAYRRKKILERELKKLRAEGWIICRQEEGEK